MSMALTSNRTQLSLALSAIKVVSPPGRVFRSLAERKRRKSEVESVAVIQRYFVAGLSFIAAFIPVRQRKSFGSTAIHSFIHLYYSLARTTLSSLPPNFLCSWVEMWCLISTVTANLNIAFCFAVTNQLSLCWLNNASWKKNAIVYNLNRLEMTKPM